MKKKKTFICRRCREEVTVIVDVGYRPIFCTECNRIRQKENRGRSGEEMDSLRNLPPVKVFTREEIAEVAHLMTPPRRAKRSVNVSEVYIF